jgi:ABC-2 type transport system ATP-binding protein
MPELAIDARSLAMRFARGRTSVEALRGIDLAVAAGEVFGLLGPNGAGKTTTLRILTGQLTPTGGSATVAGCDVIADRRTLHGRIGVVFDQPNLYEALTGRQNLVLFADLYGADRSLVGPLLEKVGMTEAADRRFKTYSKGMKQRVLLARALLPSPAVLFLDEPTSGLDPASAKRVRELVAEAKAGGATIFLNTHQLELADAVCDRLAIMHAGRVVETDTPAGLKRSHGAPRLVVTTRTGDTVTLDYAAAETPERLAALVRSGDAVHVATEAPSLEEVFLRISGSDVR